MMKLKIKLELLFLAMLAALWLKPIQARADVEWQYDPYTGGYFPYYYDSDDDDDDDDDEDDEDDDEDDEDDDEEYDEEEETVGEWKKSGGKWYYYDENNKKAKGWIKYDGDIYYLGEDGAREEGLSKIKKGVYYFGKDGKLRTGWKTVNHDRYYFSTDPGFGEKGKAATGFQYLDGARYHFQSTGVMDTGKIRIGSGEYYFKTTGEQKVGWINVDEDSKRYFFTGNDKGKKYGQMAKDMTYKGHYFAGNGLTSRTMDYCKEVLDSVGWNLRAAYNWSASLSYSGRTTYLENWGSAKLANQGFAHKTGNCYVMAATFYELAECMGYDAHQIAGAVPSRRGGLANHSWVEIEENGEVWVYDPNCTMETRADRYHFKYGTPGTWRYTGYHRMN